MTQANPGTTKSEQQQGKHEGHAVLEIPLTVGVVGTLVAPWLAAVGAMGALLTQCTIEVVRPDSPGELPPAQG